MCLNVSCCNGNSSAKLLWGEYGKRWDTSMCACMVLELPIAHACTVRENNYRCIRMIGKASLNKTVGKYGVRKGVMKTQWTLRKRKKGEMGGGERKLVLKCRWACRKGCWWFGFELLKLIQQLQPRKSQWLRQCLLVVKPFEWGLRRGCFAFLRTLGCATDVSGRRWEGGGVVWPGCCSLGLQSFSNLGASGQEKHWTLLFQWGGPVCMLNHSPGSCQPQTVLVKYRNLASSHPGAFLSPFLP